MKKLIALMLCLVLAVAAFGCNNTPATEGDPTDAPDQTQTEAPEATDAPEATEPVEGDGEQKVYNVVSLVNGNLGDKSFFDSAESGLKALQDAGRITYKTIEMGGTDEDQPKWLEPL